MSKREAFLAYLQARDNFVTIEDFMAFWLHNPRYGSYVTEQPVGGARPDFVTAPEITSLFGELCALWYLHAAAQTPSQGIEPTLQVVEFGPGTGTLSCDILGTLQKFGLKKLHVLMLEINPYFIQQQRQRLAPLIESGHVRLQHATSLAALAAQLDPNTSLFCYSNEFLDALPSRQYHEGTAGIRECGVAYDAATKQLAYVPPEGSQSCFEHAPQRENFLDQVCTLLARMRAFSAALFVDYGYTMARHGTSLQAMRHGQMAPVLDSEMVGDLTTHVDFTRLHQIASHVGSRSGLVSALSTQGYFLQKLGIQERFARLKHGQGAERARVAQSIERLVVPGQMGTLFKVLQVVTQNRSSGLFSDLPASAAYSIADKYFPL